MDKNTVTGFILIALVIIGFSWYSRPSQEELEAMAKRDSIESLTPALSEGEGDSSVVEEDSSRASRLFSHPLEGQGETVPVVLHNTKVKVTLCSKGATVEDAEIIGYKSRRRDGDVVILGKEDASMRLTLPLKEENLCFSDIVFAIKEQTDSTVTFAAEQDGKLLNVRYTLRPDAYMLDMDITSQGLAGLAMPGASNLLIEWTARIAQQEKGADFENRYSALTYMRHGKGVKKLPPKKGPNRKKGRFH